MVMPKQIRWAYEAGFFEGMLAEFLPEELNDVNPLLIKITRYSGVLCAVFYPVGVKELDTLPSIGSTDRWTPNSEEFDGPSYPASLRACDFVVSVLDNLDPQEAIYAKVVFDYDLEPSRILATVIVPEGAK
jgi:hypothetical protein